MTAKSCFPNPSALNSQTASPTKNTEYNLDLCATTPSRQVKGPGITRHLSKRLPFLGRSKVKQASAGNDGLDNTSSQPSTHVTAAAAAANSQGLSSSCVTPSPSAVSSAAAAQPSPNARRLEHAKLKKNKKTKKKTNTDNTNIHGSPCTTDSPSGPPPLTWSYHQPSPWLNVEIPDITMERYSIMFKSCLEIQPATAGSRARRQTTESKLRLVGDDDKVDAAELQRSRRVLVPLHQSPAGLVDARPMPERAHTCPAPVGESAAASDKENGTALSPSPRGHATRRAFDRQPIRAAQSHAVNIPERFTSLGKQKPLTALTSSSSTSSSSSSSSSSSQPGAINEEVAEVSIARQVSISRHQRRMLEPLREREMRRARAKKHIRAASQISMDDGTKRIVETKTGMPTLIHLDKDQKATLPRNLSSSPYSHYMQQHRKSEYVVIEG